MLVAEDSDRAHDEEDILRREVVWTLFMMDRIFIGQNISRPCIPASSFDLFVFERGPLLPERSTGFNSFVTLREIIHHHNNNRTFSLMAVNIHLLSIWEDMMRDVFETRSGRTDTFWHDGSSWSKIQSRLWEYEMRMSFHFTSQQICYLTLTAASGTSSPVHERWISNACTTRPAHEILLLDLAVLSSAVLYDPVLLV